MSAAQTLVAGPSMMIHFKRNNNGLIFNGFCAGKNVCNPSLNGKLFRNAVRLNRRSNFSSVRPCPVMEWQDCRVRLEIDVPCSIAYNLYSNREAFPHWMPFISSVKVLKNKPDQSKWTLKYKALGQDLEFSWLARNLQPIPNQKIHWHSLDGLPNRGAVRFYPKGPSSCNVELTVSYEVPPILTGVTSALKPFLEGLLLRGLEQFATFAERNHADPRKV